VRAWDLPSARELQAITAVPPGSIALSANGRYLAVTTLDGGVVRDLRTQDQGAWVTGDRLPVDPRVRIAIASSGEWVAGARAESGEVTVWPTKIIRGKSAQPVSQSGRVRKVFPASTAALKYLAFTPDDKFVMSSDGDSLRFWSMESPRPETDARP